MKPNIEIHELKCGCTQVIIRQTSPDDEVCGGICEATLVLRNYSDGYVEVGDGEDSILISPKAANEVAKWIRKLPGLTPK